MADQIPCFSTTLSTATLSPLPGINIRTREDLAICAITGAILLPAGKLLVCDFSNMCLKRVDITSSTVTSRLQFPSQPWELAVLPDDQVAVTLAQIGQIHFITVGAELTPFRTIDVGLYCRGIQAVGADLVVTYTGFPNRITIMDNQGNVRSTICNDSQGQLLFQKPFYLAVAREGDTDVLYTSNRRNNTLVKLDMNGRVLFSFRSQELVRPHGLTTTRGGEILVCCDNHQVNLVSPTGQKIRRTLLTEADGLFRPRVICVSEDMGKLFVFNRNADEINVYKIN